MFELPKRVAGDSGLLLIFVLMTVAGLGLMVVALFALIFTIAELAYAGLALFAIGGLCWLGAWLLGFIRYGATWDD